MCPSEGAPAQLKRVSRSNLLFYIGGSSSDEDLPVWNTMLKVPAAGAAHLL